MPPQPSHAQFAQRVRAAVLAADPSTDLWVEDECCARASGWARGGRGTRALVARGDVPAAIELVLPCFDAAYRHRVAAGPPRRRLAVVGLAEGALLVVHPANPFTPGTTADHRLAVSSVGHVPGAHLPSCVLARRRQRSSMGERTYGMNH